MEGMNCPECDVEMEFDSGEESDGVTPSTRASWMCVECGYVDYEPR